MTKKAYIFMPGYKVENEPKLAPKNDKKRHECEAYPRENISIDGCRGASAATWDSPPCS
jgi:hypothetical protein